MYPKYATDANHKYTTKLGPIDTLQRMATETETMLWISISAIWLLFIVAVSAQGSSNETDSEDENAQELSKANRSQLSPLSLLQSITNSSDPNDRALLRTLSQIHGKASNGQLLLLVCNRPCPQHRKQIPRWSREYQQRKNKSSDEPINYHYHSLRSYTGDHVHHFPLVMYIVAGRGHTYDGQLDDEDQFNRWLTQVNDWRGATVRESSDWRDLDRILDSVGECGHHKWLIIIQHLSTCPISNWKNILRSSKTLRNVSMFHITRPLTLQNQVILRSRLHLPDYCQMMLILHNNASLSIPTTWNPSQVRAALRELDHRCNTTTKTIDNNPDVEQQDWHGISPGLNDIQLEYLSRELALSRLEHNPTYIIVGLTGGMAVIALAISIFWALNTFAK